MRCFFIYVTVPMLFFSTCYAPTSVYLTNDTPFDVGITVRASGGMDLDSGIHYRVTGRTIKVDNRYILGIKAGTRARILRLNRHDLPGKLGQPVIYTYETDLQLYENGKKKGRVITLSQELIVPSVLFISHMNFGIIDPKEEILEEITEKIVEGSTVRLFKLPLYKGQKLYVLGMSIKVGTFDDLEYVIRLVPKK